MINDALLSILAGMVLFTTITIVENRKRLKLKEERIDMILDDFSWISKKHFNMTNAKEVVCNCKDKGMDMSGEYDIESNMHCPVCNEIVGDYENNDLWCKHCPECGQRVKYTAVKE